MAIYGTVLHRLIPAWLEHSQLTYSGQMSLVFGICALLCDERTKGILENTMKVALVNPPFSKLIYGEERSIKSITPCLGLFYLQAYCRELAEIEVFEGEFYPTLDKLISEV